MSDGMRFEGREIRRWSRDLAGASQRAFDAAEVVLTKSTQDMARDARALAPVDTGNLRSSISYEVRHLAGGGMEGVASASASYASHVEEGTSTQPPQPFMAPAFDRQLPALQAALERVLGEALG